MIGDLVLAFGWTPATVRALPLEDVQLIAKAAERRDRRARAKKGRR